MKNALIIKLLDFSSVKNFTDKFNNMPILGTIRTFGFRFKKLETRP